MMKKTWVDADELPGTIDDVGWVYHDVDDANKVLRNITLPGHAFHPGQIERSVVVDSQGNIKVISHGTGVGTYPELNSMAGPIVFRGIDEVVQHRVEGLGN